jgi:hypothetical protein
MLGFAEKVGIKAEDLGDEAQMFAQWAIERESVEEIDNVGTS